VENLAEDADNDFFSRVLHNENHILHIIRTKRSWLGPMNCDADAMNGGYSYVQRCHARRNFIYRQLHKYRPSY